MDKIDLGRCCFKSDRGVFYTIIHKEDNSGLSLA